MKVQVVLRDDKGTEVETRDFEHETGVEENAALRLFVGKFAEAAASDGLDASIEITILPD